MILSAPLYVAGILSFGAPQATCPALTTPPVIRVEMNVAQPGIDHTLPRSQLKSFEITTVSPYGNGADVHVNGLMRGAIVLESQMSLAWQRSRDESVNCSWYESVVLHMKLNPTIFVAREIPANSCLYREVLNHEYRHYQTDFNITREYQVILQNELQRFVTQAGVIGPYSKAQQESIKNDMAGRLEKTIQAVNDRMKAERIKRQALIDTRDEYERVMSACPPGSV